MNMIRKEKFFAVLWAVLLALTSCEKPNFGLFEEEEVVPDGYVRLKFNITHFEQIPFSSSASYSRGTTDASGVCTRINLAIFNEEGKVAAINQSIDEEKFGEISVFVPEGDYTAVILAHSCNGNATISKPEEIKFPNNKVTDTFFYCGEVTADGDGSIDIQMRRAVAKFVLETEDKLPQNVAEVTFKYTGGSSTFDAVKGYGCVNSRQTEVRTVTEEMRGKPASFEIYTLPHNDTGELKITVTVADENGNTLAERNFENVPVKVNQITRYTGDFFGSLTQFGNASIKLKFDADWTHENYTY